MWACTASTAARSKYPRATPAWLVTTATGMPAAFRAATASKAPGTKLHLVDGPDIPRVDDQGAIAIEQDSGRAHVSAGPLDPRTTIFMVSTPLDD